MKVMIPISPMELIVNDDKALRHLIETRMRENQ